MLEAKEYVFVDNVSPLLDVVVDRYCGQQICAPVTQVLKMYVNVMQSIYRWNGEHGWADNEAEELEKKIIEMNKRVVELFC